MLLFDKKHINSSFFNELKDLVKKEPLLSDIYMKKVVPFLFCCLANGYDKIKHKCEIKEISDYYVLSHNIVIENTTLVKFRVRLSGRGSSASARISAIFVTPFKGIIPLEIYTHGIKGNGKSTPIDSLAKKFKVVYEKITPLI